MASWRGAQRWLTLGAAVACAAVLVAVAGSGRVQLGRSGAALASTSVRQQISAEVRDVLRHAQARRPMLPEHLLPKQVLAERDMKKGAWRGLGDKVVREFDSVFSAHKQQGKHMKPGAHHAPKGAKHEKDKGDFLLKMGLVSKGGYVRVWVPDPPSKAAKTAAAGEAATASSAAASRPGAVSEAASRHELAKEASNAKGAKQSGLDTRARQMKLQERRSEGHRCNPALQLGCPKGATLDMPMAPIALTKQPPFPPHDTLSMAQKPAKSEGSARKQTEQPASAAAAAGISKAVAEESKLATQWAHDEGVPQPELPDDAVAQTREAVANTLSNALLEAKQAEDKFADVQSNMQQLHAAISRVEAVAQSFTHVHAAHASHDAAEMPELNMRHRGEDKMEEKRMAERRWMEERRQHNMLAQRHNMLAQRHLSPAQLALQHKYMGAEATDFDADELSLWSAQAQRPAALTYMSPQQHESLDAITHSLARLSAKFAREAASPKPQ